MRPEASNKFTVHCDICHEPMRESGMAGAGHSAFLCYPCSNVIYESELWQYDAQVKVHREVDALALPPAGGESASPSLKRNT